MRIAVIGLVAVAVVFLGTGLALANGGAKTEITPVEKQEVKPAEAVSKTASLKSPGTACFLSVLMPGLGQVYNGDIGKAMIMGGVEGLCWIMIGQDLDGIGILGMVMGRIISPVEAYYSALNKNQGLALEINKEKVLVAYKTTF